MAKKRLFTLEPKDMDITIAQKPVSPSRHVIIAMVPLTSYQLDTGLVRISGLAQEALRRLALRAGSARDEQ
jgi:hypothetical protein